MTRLAVTQQSRAVPGQLGCRALVDVCRAILGHQTRLPGAQDGTLDRAIFHDIDGRFRLAAKQLMPIRKVQLRGGKVLYIVWCVRFY